MYVIVKLHIAIDWCDDSMFIMITPHCVSEWRRIRGCLKDRSFHFIS